MPAEKKDSHARRQSESRRAEMIYRDVATKLGTMYRKGSMILSMQEEEVIRKELLAARRCRTKK